MFAHMITAIKDFAEHLSGEAGHALGFGHLKHGEMASKAANEVKATEAKLKADAEKLKNNGHGGNSAGGHGNGGPWHRGPWRRARRPSARAAEAWLAGRPGQTDRPHRRRPSHGRTRQRGACPGPALRPRRRSATAAAGRPED